MEKLVSKLVHVQTVPKDYIFPVKQRPGDQFSTPISIGIPVINLENEDHDRKDTVIQQIITACQDFGFFQVWILF